MEGAVPEVVAVVPDIAEPDTAGAVPEAAGAVPEVAGAVSVVVVVVVVVSVVAGVVSELAGVPDIAPEVVVPLLVSSAVEEECCWHALTETMQRPTSVANNILRICDSLIKYKLIKYMRVRALIKHHILS